MNYFIDTPPFVFTFTGNPAKPLHPVKVTEKEIIVISVGSVFHTDELNYKKNYLKLTQSPNRYHKIFPILPNIVLLYY